MNQAQPAILSVNLASFIGRDFGTVTIIKEIGHGGKGVVFAGFQKSLKRQVAVKILPKQVVLNEQDQEQFFQEAQIVAGLNHPNIIPIYDMGAEADCYYQIMLLVSGCDLNTLILNKLKHPVLRKRLLPLDYTLDTIIKVLDGLEYAHQQGIVHQDIKPANILIESLNNRPLIADFGIAKAAELEQKQKKGVVTGSPIYLSPEQASCIQTDARTDIYALGVVLFKMVAGSLPKREESSEAIIIRKIQEPESFFTKKPSEVSFLADKELDRIIAKAVHHDVNERYQNCTVFKQDLVKYRSSINTSMMSQAL